MRKAYLLLSSLFFASYVNASDHTIKYDGIVATINGDIITKSDLDERVRLVLLSMGKDIPADIKEKIKHDVLQEMCNELLQNQLAKKYVTFTPNKRWVEEKEIDEAVQSIIKRNNMNIEQFRELLKKHKISEKCFRKQIASNMTWINFIRMKHGGSVRISDQELKQLRNEYNKHRNETIYLVQRIVIPVSGNNGEEIALSKVHNITELLNRGVAFDELARQFSQGVSAQKGGNIGWMFADQLSKEESVSIKNLETGKTAVVKNNRGYIILKLKSKRINDADHITKIKFAQIALPLNQGYPRAEVEAYLNDLKRQYPTANALVKGAQGKAYVSNIETAVVDELNPDFAKIINGLNTGSISKNHVMNGALVVVCLLDKTQEKVKPISDEDLKNQRIEEKMNKLSEQEKQRQRRISNIKILL